MYRLLPVWAPFVAVLCTSCEKDNKSSSSAAKVTGAVSAPVGLVVAPPLDLKNPPADAVKKPSGLVIKTLVPAPAGAVPKRNDTVMIKYTGWRQASGETFFSNMKEQQPMPLNL